jgi:hypothetical protein
MKTHVAGDDGEFM